MAVFSAWGEKITAGVEDPCEEKKKNFNYCGFLWTEVFASQPIIQHQTGAVSAASLGDGEKLCCFTFRCSFWRLWLQRQMNCSNLLAQKRPRSSVIAPWYHPIRGSPYSWFFVCFRQDIWYRKASCFKNACWFCQITPYLSSIPSLFQLLQVV